MTKPDSTPSTNAPENLPPKGFEVVNESPEVLQKRKVQRKLSPYLVNAVRDGNLEALKALIEAGADPSYRAPAVMADASQKSGETFLVCNDKAMNDLLQSGDQKAVPAVLPAHQVLDNMQSMRDNGKDNKHKPT